VSRQIILGRTSRGVPVDFPQSRFPLELFGRLPPQARRHARQLENASATVQAFDHAAGHRIVPQASGAKRRSHMPGVAAILRGNIASSMSISALPVSALRRIIGSYPH